MTDAERALVGIHHGLDINQYHAGPGLSKTMLDAVHRSVAHYLALLQTPREATPAMVLGSAIHTAILEPELYKAQFVVVEGDGRTKEVKEARSEAAKTGKTVLTGEQGDTVRKVSDAFFAHPTAPSVVEEGEPEVSLFWEDEETGLLLKARPDWLREDGDVMDLKTTKDARANEFSRTIYNFRYHVQAAMIADACNALDLDFQNFMPIALETEAPYCLTVFRLDSEAVELGRKAYRADLKRLVEYRDKQSWAGYDYQVVSVGVPAWAARQEGGIYE